jgi:alpha-mannosidase
MVPYQTTNKAEAYGLGYVFAGPATLAIGTEKHEGKLQASADYVRFDNEFIRMSAFKKGEYNDNVILRLFNTSEQAQAVTLNVPAFTAAALTNLGEEKIEDLTVENGKITLDVPAKKIVTVELH